MTEYNVVFASIVFLHLKCCLFKQDLITDKSVINRQTDLLMDKVPLLKRIHSVREAAKKALFFFPLGLVAIGAFFLKIK